MILFMILLFTCFPGLSAFSQSETGMTAWTDWTSGTTGIPGSADGTLTLPDGTTIFVTYYGEVRSAQTSGGTNYWNPPDAYLSTLVTHAPPASDIVTLAGGNETMNTISFSQPLENPIMAIVSLGTSSKNVTYAFDTPFTILSKGKGYWGNGDLLNTEGNILQGNEGHGVIQFMGTFSSLSWTASIYENWHGFTIGVAGGGSVVIPPGDCSQEELDEQFKAGMEYCKQYPKECGIKTGGDYQAGYDAGYDAGMAGCQGNEGCTDATLGADLTLYIPSLNYETFIGTFNLWAEFEFIGDEEGELIWRLSDFGE